VRNSALFDNAGDSQLFAHFSYCSFDADTCPTPQGTNICGIEQGFIDPDRGVYFVRAGSPLLDQGEGGGQIGAFGQGFHSSKDPLIDEPPQLPPEDPWKGWVDETNTPISESTLVEINGEGEIVLAALVTSAGVYSPVFDSGGSHTVIRSIDFAAFEDTSFPTGEREVIDAVEGTPQREILIRTQPDDGNPPFDQNPTITPPAFETKDKQAKFAIRARYVQIGLVLRNNGD
jgi:hypothetical protein